MQFSVRHTLKEGFDTWKQYWGISALFCLIFVLISALVPGLFELVLRKGVVREHIEHPFVALLFGLLIPILNFLFTSYASMGFINVNLKMSAREPVQLKDFFAANRFFARFLGGSILISIIFMISSFLLSIPTLLLSIWAIGETDSESMSRISAILSILSVFFLVAALAYIFVSLFQWSYYLIDQSTSLMESFQKSITSSKGHRVRLLLLSLILVFLIFLGAMFLLVGLFVTAPIASLSWAHAYRALKNPT